MKMMIAMAVMTQKIEKGHRRNSIANEIYMAW